jgi:hypothetical protein
MTPIPPRRRDGGLRPAQRRDRTDGFTPDCARLDAIVAIYRR